MIRRPMIGKGANSILKKVSLISDMEFGEYKSRKFIISIQGITTAVDVKGRSNFFADEKVMATFINGLWPNVKLLSNQFKVRLGYKVFFRFTKKKIRVEFNYNFLKGLVPKRKYVRRLRRFSQFFAHMIYYGDGLEDLIYDVKNGSSDLIVFPPESGGFTVISKGLIPLDFNSASKLFKEEMPLKMSSTKIGSENGRFKRLSFREASGLFLGTKVLVNGRRGANVVFAFNGFITRVTMSGESFRVRNGEGSRLTNTDLQNMVYSIHKFRGRKRYFVRKAIIIFIQGMKYTSRFVDLGLLAYWLDEPQTLNSEYSRYSPKYINLLKDEIRLRRFASHYFPINNELNESMEVLKKVMTRKLAYKKIITDSNKNIDEKSLYDIKIKGDNNGYWS